MSAIRVPLLCAFAGGCLSNAVLFGLWRTADSPDDSAGKPQHRSHNVAELVTAATAAPKVEPAPSQAISDADSGAPTPAGSAVSDVLMQLEAAYRARVAARAPVHGSATPEQASAAAPADGAVVAAEAARAAAAPAVADVIPALPVVTAAKATEPPALAPAAFAPAAPAPAAPIAAAPIAAAPIAAAPIAAAPIAAAPIAAAFAPQVAALPAAATPDAPPPSEIHYGDVNQNTYVTNVRLGDVYLIQVQQQLAMLQYLQLLGLSPGLAAPGRHVGGARPQRVPFPSGITNPDNPWGFQFAPPNLVR